MPTLYYSPGACSLAIHILLEELGTPYRLAEVSIAKGANRTPEYLALNPKGRVPALALDSGDLLTELPAIATYLALSHPDAGLLPRDPLGVARCLEWFNWLSGSTHATAFALLWRPARFSDDEAVFPAITAKGRQRVEEDLGAIERQLSDRNWAVGDGLTVVDPFLLVLYVWGLRVGLDMAGRYPHWTRHARQLRALPAVERAFAQERLEVDLG